MTFNRLREELYKDKITIINKLRAEDSPDGKEHFQKTVYNTAYWCITKIATYDNKETSVSKAIKVLIPDLKMYLPYIPWARYSGESEYFTMSINDYIVKGEVLECVNSQTINKVLKRYEPNVCKVQYINIPKGNRGIVQMELQG